mgnify:CR=1 FL=1
MSQIEKNYSSSQVVIVRRRAKIAFEMKCGRMERKKFDGRACGFIYSSRRYQQKTKCLARQARSVKPLVIGLREL